MQRKLRTPLLKEGGIEKVASGKTERLEKTISSACTSEGAISNRLRG
jgi:hypothetical protein